jgi:hypothetical protein
MTTRKVWLLCCGILLATAARAHCQEVGCNAGTSKPTQAPYYNQLADVIYPPPACSEPVQWVRLFEAMANQRHGEQRWAPVAGPLTDDLRIQYRRDSEQDRVIMHTMKELYWILAETEGETIREQTAPSRACGVTGDTEECLPAGRVMANEDVERYLYDLLQRERCIRQPHLNFTLHVRTVEGKKLIDPVFVCRDPRGKSDDTIVRADEAELRADFQHHQMILCMYRCRISSRQSGICGFMEYKEWPVDLPTVIVPDGVWIQGTYHLTVPGIDATAQRMTWIREKGQMLLEGNVVLELSKANHPAKILTERALINLQDGTYEVMPPNLENTERILKPTSAVVPVTPAARGWR